MSLSTYLKSSIGKKQIVAVTGLIWVLFILGHLAGNLFIYGGPEAFNGYAKKLASLRPGLYVVEIGLAAVILIHMITTALLVLQNIKARGKNYAVYASKAPTSIASRLMPISGIVIIVFLVYHLLDFTFINHHGDRSVLADGQSYGLYGVVYNSFSDPIHSLLYVIAMFSLSLHLSHGVQSLTQTFGFNHPRYTPMIHQFSNVFGFIVAVGYSSIPVYIYTLNTCPVFK